MKKQIRRKREGTVSKKVTHKSGAEVVKETENTDKFYVGDEVNPAYVGVTVGYTKNLGNYESVKVNVSISVPVKPKESEIRKSFDNVSELCEELLKTEMENTGNE